MNSIGLIRTFNTICHSNKYKMTVLRMTNMSGKQSIEMPLVGKFTVTVNSTSVGIIYTAVYDGYHYSCEEARFTDYFYTEQQLRDLKIDSIISE